LHKLQKQKAGSPKLPLAVEARLELELELIQTHLIQKPMLRVEVCTRALRASQNVKNPDDAVLFEHRRFAIIIEYLQGESSNSKRLTCIAFNTHI